MSEQNSDYRLDVLIRGRGGTSIKATSGELDFVTIPVRASLRRGLLLTREGAPGELRVASVYTEEKDSSFHLVSDAVDELIGPDGVNLELEFQPDAEGLFADELIIEAEGVHHARVRVPLLGTANASLSDRCELGVHPPQLRAGLVRTQVLHRREVLLLNKGDDPCWIKQAKWFVRSEGHRSATYSMDPIRSVTLAPGEWMPLGFTEFEYQDDWNSNSIRVAVYFARFPVHSIIYNSRHDPRAPIIEPNQLFFEAPELGSRVPLSFMLDDLKGVNMVGSIELAPDSSPAFSLISSPVDAGTPVDGMIVEVAFEPSSEGFHDGQVEVMLFGFPEPIRVDLVGYVVERAE